MLKKQAQKDDFTVTLEQKQAFFTVTLKQELCFYSRELIANQYV
jgi:hypothetical protein